MRNNWLQVINTQTGDGTNAIEYVTEFLENKTTEKEN
jgi:hypothetical protein